MCVWCVHVCGFSLRFIVKHVCGCRDDKCLFLLVVVDIVDLWVKFWDQLWVRVLPAVLLCFK